MRWRSAPLCACDIPKTMQATDNKFEWNILYCEMLERQVASGKDVIVVELQVERMSNVVCAGSSHTEEFLRRLPSYCFQRLDGQAGREICYIGAFWGDVLRVSCQTFKQAASAL